MTEKRFRVFNFPDVDKFGVSDDITEVTVAFCDTKWEADSLCDLLNELHEENMSLRAKNTQFVIILKDVVNDLKRMDTYRYAKHLEKIANLHFLSEKELGMND